MADEKENMHEGKIFRRSKRRSSILKESPGRKPLENMTEKHQQRRSKRVSFADTKTIKEFLAIAGSGTEWNSTYEATASCDSSTSMDITCMGERSNRSLINVPNDQPASGSYKKDSEDSSTDDSLGFVRDILDWDSSKSAPGTDWDPFDEPDEVVPTNDSFLTSFLNMKSSDCVKANVGETSKTDNYGSKKDQMKKKTAQPLSLFSAAAEDSFTENQMDVLLRDEMAQQMIEDLKMTCRGEDFIEKTKTNTGQTTEKVGLNQVKPADDINGHTSQIRTLLEGDLTFGDMDMTLGVCLSPGLLSPVNSKRTDLGVEASSKDLAERVIADSEVTFSGNPVSTLLQKSNMTDMIDHISLNREDITRRVTTDMEMTQAASHMVALTEGDMVAKNNQIQLNQDVSRKVTTDKEITYPSSVMSLHPKSDVNQKTELDMELTYPSIRIANPCDVDRTQTMNMITVNREDLTQKVTADMEMTCPISQINNKPRRSFMNEKPIRDMELTCKTINVNREDLTQKATTDMEMTCPISQISNQPRRSVMNEEPIRDMELTCKTINVNREDLTQKVMADMEMTCPISQINNQPRRSVMNEKPIRDMELTCKTINVNREDLTQKATTDMEMTCPISQISNQPRRSVMNEEPIRDMEMTSKTINVNREDLTQKVTADMEMTCPISQISNQPRRSVMNEEPIRDMEMTCKTINVNREDLTQKVMADMEMTCRISQISNQPRRSVMNEEPIRDMEMTSKTINVNREDLTQKVTGDMEMTCPISQMNNQSRRSVMNEEPIRDMELTCKTINVNREDLTQKVTADMEMTCPISQINNQPRRSVMNEEPIRDMELTCKTINVNREDLTQKVTGDMEMTCPISQMNNQSRRSVMNEEPIRDMELTCKTINVNREDLTQKVTADMEMTCPISQINNQPRRSVMNEEPIRDMELTCKTINVNREDLTQKVTADMEMTCPISQMNNQSRRSVMNEEPIRDMELTCKTINVNREDLTQKVTGDMEMTCPISQMNNQSRRSVMNEEPIRDMELTCKTINVNREDLTQKVTADMEMTCPISQINNQPRRSVMNEEPIRDMELTCKTINVNREDLTQKVTADMEMTCPISQMNNQSRRSVMNEEPIRDMELTCKTINVNREDLTQKVTADMEMTCPISQISNQPRSVMNEEPIRDMELTCKTINVNREDLTQKVTADMEMTCPISQINNQPRRNVMNEKLSGDMELTCKTINVNREDLTQKVTADMEMTCPISQMNNQSRRSVMNEEPIRDMELTCKTINVNQEDLTKKVTADMETTCPISQMNNQPRRSVMNEEPIRDMELTCKTINVNREDLTQKVMADMEMTCPISQINNQPRRSVMNEEPIRDMELTCKTINVNREDLTQKVMADMEMTCPISQINNQPRRSVMNEEPIRDMEMTCKTINVNREDLTQKVTGDMEMTCPISQMNNQSRRSVMNEEPIRDMELTCKTINVNREDLTQKVTADMEITCPISQMNKQPRRSVMRERPIGDMELTCQTITGNREDLSQKLGADMEMTCPTSQMNNRPRSVMNEKPSGDMEINCKTINVNRENITPKVNLDIEDTCPAILTVNPNSSGMTQRMNKMTLSQEALTENRIEDQEKTCQSVLPDSLLEGNTTQKGNGAIELTCPVITVNQEELTQKATTEMEMTSVIETDKHPQGISRTGMSCKLSLDKDIWNVTGQKNNSHDIDTDMEITSSMSNVSEKRENYCVQDTNADDEISRSGKTLSEVHQLDEISPSTHAVSLCDSQVSKSTFAERTSPIVRSSDGALVEMVDKEVTSEALSSVRVQENTLRFGPDSEPTEPNVEERDMGQISGRDVCAEVGKRTFNDTLESINTIDGKARDYTKNNTCPASQILEMLNRNEVPRRKSLCFGFSNSEGFVDTIDKKTVSLAARKEEETVVSRRKSVNIMSPSDFNKSCNMSRPLFRSFFDEPQDSKEELDTPTEGSVDKNVNQNMYGESSQEVSPKSNHKRSHDIDNEDERSSKKLSRDDSPGHLSKSIDNGNCQEGINFSFSLPSPKGNEDPLSVSLSVEENELCLHISSTEPLSRLSVEDKTELDAVVDAPGLAISPSAKDNTFQSRNSSSQGSTDKIKDIQASNGKTSVDGDGKVETKNNSQSEEGLEDIQMDFESSCELSFSHSPLAKLEGQSPSAPVSANQSLFDVVGTDAFSSVKALMTSFKKRMSDFHEGHSSLRNSLVDEDGFLIEMEQENAGPTPCDISVQSSSCNMAKDTKVGCLSEQSSVGGDDQMISHVMDKEISQSSNSSMDTETPECSGDKTAGNISSISIPDPSQALMSELQDSVKNHRAIVSIDPEPVNHLLAEDIRENSPTPVRHVPEQRQEKTKNINTLEFIPKKTLEQKFCDLCCSSESLGSCFMPASSKAKRWIITGVEERVRYFTLQHSNLELALKVTRTGNHWTVSTASWKPQASGIFKESFVNLKKIKEKIGQLVMQLLQCRIKAAILPLYGQALCQIADELDNVVSAYRGITMLTLELFLVEAAYLTEFKRDSIRVNLFSSVHHVNAYITVNLRPPEPTPDKPYAIQPSAEVTIGNLRSQAVEQAMADVADGPRYIWRLVKAADMVIQGMV